ncbi:MAG: tetratricopeptide repeat protein [Verrucomicrobiota bacterium]
MKQFVHLSSIFCGLGCLVFAGCGTTSSSERSAAKAKPSHHRTAADNTDLLLTQTEELRVEALARFARGIIHEMNDEPVQAFDQFYQAALSDPDNESLVLDVARRLIQRKQGDKAVDLLVRAAAMPDSTGLVDAWLGLAYAQSGKTDLAIAANRNAIKKTPRSLQAYQNLSKIYLQNGQAKAGLEILDAAAKQPNLDAASLIDLAETFADYGQLRKEESDLVKPRVLDALNRATELKPENPMLLERLADGYKLMSETQKAVKVYEQILQQEPDQPNLRAKLIDLYLSTDDKKKAVEQLEALIRDKPTNPTPYYYLGIIAQEQEKYDKAKDYLETAVLLSPETEQFYYDLALLQINLGKSRDALATLDRARAKFRQSFAMEWYSGIASSALRKYDNALTHYTAAEVLASATDPKRLNHVFYFHLGETYERKEDYSQAEKYFSKCLELSPKYTQALNYYGYMYADLGIHLDKARAMIEQAVELDPKNAAYLDSLGWVLFKLKLPSEALPYILKAIEQTKEPDPTLYDHLGDVYAELKQSEKARDTWEKSLTCVQKDLANRTENTDPSLFDLMGDLYAKLNQIDQAQGAWRKALALGASAKIQKKLESHSLETAPLR